MEYILYNFNSILVLWPNYNLTFWNSMYTWEEWIFYCCWFLLSYSWFLSSYFLSLLFSSFYFLWVPFSTLIYCEGTYIIDFFQPLFLSKHLFKGYIFSSKHSFRYNLRFSYVILSLSFGSKYFLIYITISSFTYRSFRNMWLKFHTFGDSWNF